MSGADRSMQRPVDAETEPIFEHPPILAPVLESAEQAVRRRLVRVKLLRRILLLDRDWMTRITVLTLLLAGFWGAVGGTDILSTREQVVAWATGRPLLLSNQETYTAITMHGIRMLFGFTQQFELAIFGVIVVNATGIVPRNKWLLYLAVALFNLSIVLIEGPIYPLPFNDNYLPSLGWYFLAPLGIAGHSAYVATPLWYAGWLLLAVAALTWSAWLVALVYAWWRQAGQTEARRRMPAFLLFIVANSALMFISYGALLVTTVWDLGAYGAGWALYALPNQVSFWLFGHGLVYVVFFVPLVAYYLLVPIFARRPVYSYRAAVLAAVLFVVVSPVLAIHHLFLTPLPAWAIWLTSSLGYVVVIPSAITFFSIWMTTKGVPAGQWEWNTVTLFLVVSFAGSIAGGLTGPVNNTVAWNVDLHNTLFVVGHFHALTILSIVTGAYALAYAFFPILVQRRWYSAWMSRLHFLLTTIGGAGVVVAMDLLGETGLLRRSFLYPLTSSIVGMELFLAVSVAVILVGQLFFAANLFLTFYWGRNFSFTGRSFDEAVRAAAQSTLPAPRQSPRDLPYVRELPRRARERAEVWWVGTVSALLVVVLATSTPATLATATAISEGSAPPAGAVFVDLVGHQYYWSVRESGPINGTYDSVVVARAGEWIEVNATAVGATQSLYLPFRSEPTVNVQAVPGITSHTLFQAPSTPGVYGAPDGEYDGPWWGQDVAALVVLPASGAAYPGLGPFAAPAYDGDIYNPAIVSAPSAALVGDQEGLFNHSVPGPTLVDSAAGPISFDWEVPLSSLVITNYLVNVTTTDPQGQQQWAEAHGLTLPERFSLLRIDPARGAVPLSSQPIRLNAWTNTSATLGPGAYLYGVVAPVNYSYDPGGESNGLFGAQTGAVLGLWGVLWVEGP
jgi:heme/copper-type cytochrome/quinol oxidase subunit 1